MATSNKVLEHSASGGLVRKESLERKEQFRSHGEQANAIDDFLAKAVVESRHYPPSGPVLVKALALEADPPVVL